MHQSHYARVLVFGHRGASGLAPENTLAAFELAADLGADGLECDVQLTADGEVVVFHDSLLDRTTDGSGPLARHRLATLKELDVGRWFDARFAGERIPTLQEVIDRVGRRLLFNVELKTDALRGDELEKAVADIVRRNGLLERIIVSSFNPMALWRLHRLHPHLDLGLLYAPDMPLWQRRGWARHFVPFQAMHPVHSMIDAGYMRWAHRREYRVNTWTVDDPAEARRLAALGVNIVISNRPDLVCRALEENPDRL